MSALRFFIQQYPIASVIAALCVGGLLMALRSRQHDKRAYASGWVDRAIDDGKLVTEAQRRDAVRAKEAQL